MAGVGRGKTRCTICGKEKATLRCSGCLEEFCYQHLEVHRQELNQQLEDIERQRDFLRQLLTEQIEQPDNQNWMQEINQWEEKTVAMIQRVAEEARETIRKNSQKYIHQIEIRLQELTLQLRRSREEDDFNEINIQKFQQELQQLTKELNRPADIIIREKSMPAVGSVWIDVSSTSFYSIIKLRQKPFRS